MAALTADQIINTFLANADPEGRKIDYQVAASTTIYRGGFVSLKSDGYLEMYVAGSSATTSTGNRLIGIAMDAVDNSSGSDGDKRCQVLVDGSFEYALTGAVIGDVGAPVFLSDDNTLNKDASSGQFVGWIENFVSAGVVAVRMVPHDHSHPLIVRATPAITHTASHIMPLIDKTENHNGLLIMGCWELLTVATGASASVVTIRDTAGTTTGITLTSTSDAIADIVVGINTPIGGTTGGAIVIVPADLGVEAFVTTAGTSGAGKIIIMAVPIA